MPCCSTRWRFCRRTTPPWTGSACWSAPPPGGRGSFGDALLAQAERLGLRARLRFAGHCADMPAACGLADIVVVPSLQPEPFGRAVVEAQAMRRVVLAAAHGAALETVEHGVTGFLFPPGDAAALAALLRHALSLSPEQRDWLGDNARASVIAGYTTAAMQSATLAVYDELLPTPLPYPLARPAAGDAA